MGTYKENYASAKQAGMTVFGDSHDVTWSELYF